MYQDAKEELKRLEDALLEEEPQQEDNSFQLDMIDALSDIPDLPEKDKRDKLVFWLTVTVIALTCGIVGMVAFWLIRYGGAFL